MAGLGYKSFTTGEVLTAANLQGYAVDQSVMLFDDAAARTSALASPSQGMVSFLDDSGTTWVYYGLYNASTNPGGAKAAGWYPLSGSATFFGTCTRTSTNNTEHFMGASGYAFTELADTLGWHSAVTNPDRITPNVEGMYLVTATSQTAANVTGNRRIVIQRGVSYYAESTFTSAATQSTNSASATMYLNGTTDYVRGATQQSSGTSLTVTAQLSVQFIRPVIA
jgi:hypothetical protein